MRQESVKKVRIRATGAPRDSGSVSPPALEVSGNGKAIFVEKMRAKYGAGGNCSLNEQELELKIEQLWNGLKPAQREKFIGKENDTDKMPIPIKKEPMPMLERRNNCKAIAKVLDLKSTKKVSNPPNSYAQAIKGRMKSWWKEGRMINSRFCPPSPPRLFQHQQQPCTSSPPLLIAKTDPEEEEDEDSEHPLSVESSSTEKPSLQKFPTPPDTPEPPPKAQNTKIPAKIVLKRKASKEPLRIVAPPKKPAKKLMRVITVVSTGPRISYDQACEEYYRTLSQPFLLDPEPSTSTQMMPTYASIVQGERLIREYKFGHFL